MSTPEYLLSGYHALLTERSDLPRMTACGLDQARHERMLSVTGGDSTALAEIRAALDLIVAQDNSDLGNALALAYYRDQLADRNSGIPHALPAVWALLGQATRAEALAASVTDLGCRALALAQVAAALARDGRHQQAAAPARHAAEAAGGFPGAPFSRALALADVAAVLGERRAPSAGQVSGHAGRGLGGTS